MRLRVTITLGGTEKNDTPSTSIYVKRPDLRQNENIEPCKDWKWWITPHDLYENELSSYNKHAIYYNNSNFEVIITNSDPSEIIDYFCDCHKWGVYPPPWVMNYFFKQFSQYSGDKLAGKHKRFGQYFGETADGDRSNYFAKKRFAPVMRQAMRDIDCFRIWFGLTLNDSIALVVQYLETIDTSNTSHRFQKGFSSVEKCYKAYRKKDHSYKYYFRKNPPSRDDKVKMVQRYPKDAFNVHRAKFNEYLND